MQRKSNVVLVCLLLFMTCWCFYLQSQLILVNDNMDTLRNKYIDFYNEMEEKQLINESKKAEKTSVNVESLYPKDVTVNKAMCEGCLKLKENVKSKKIPDIQQPMNLCNECVETIMKGGEVNE